MSAMRKIVQNLINDVPDKKLKEVVKVVENIIDEEVKEGWSIWLKFGEDAAEGKWEDASEKHNFYLYGVSK